MGKFSPTELLCLSHKVLAIIGFVCVLFVWTVPGHTVMLRPTDDASVDVLSPDMVVINTRTLFVRDAALGEKNTFLRFNLFSLPPGLVGNDVGKAVLRLWVSRVLSAGSLELRLVTANWQEATLTANTAPMVGQVPVGRNHRSGRRLDRWCSAEQRNCDYRQFRRRRVR
jgi:hypothetical protein